MNRVAVVLGILVSALVASPAAPATSRHAEALGKLTHPVSLDLVEAAPADVFAGFGRILGLPVVVDPRVSAPVTIKFNRVSIETSMRAICESIDCVWSLSAGELVISPVATVLPATGRGPDGATAVSIAAQPEWGEALSLSLAGADFGVVIGSFAAILRVPIDVAPDLAGEKVSIELEQVPARDAVTALLDLVGAELVEVSAEPRRLAVRRRD